MNKPLFNRVTSLIPTRLLELVYCMFGLKCDFSQSERPFLRFGYIKK